MSCSTISTVMPSSSLMSWIQNAMSSVSSTLRPEDGSSSSSNFGSVQRARANSTTLRTPYGRLTIGLSRWGWRSRKSITLSAAARCSSSNRLTLGRNSRSSGDLMRRQPCDLLVQKDQMPIGRIVNPADEVEDRGLAGAVWADDRENLSRLDRETDTVDCFDAAEIHRECVRFEEDHRSRSDFMYDFCRAKVALL